MDKISVWPDVFITGTKEYSSKKEAVADCLIGWAIAMAGLAEIPEKFGDGCVCINDYVGEILTPYNVADFAKTISDSGIDEVKK